MNYWERWIGDWKKKTAHLSFEEKGAYGELLDFLYANDTHTLPASKDAIYRIAGAQSTSERRAVDALLNPESKFFACDDAGYHQQRVMIEIDKRLAYVGKQRELAIRRWDKQAAAKPKGNGEDKPEPFALPDWIPPETWAAWLKTRTRKKASNDKHALDLSVRDLDKLRAAGDDPRAVIEQSIKRGYTGLFPTKPNGLAAPTPAGIVCEDCGTRAISYTGRRCDPCYRVYMGIRTDEKHPSGIGRAALKD